MLLRKIIFAALLIILFPLKSIFGWGALAIDDNKGQKYGWAVNYPTREKAIERALNECGKGGRIVMIFESGAAAYAADQAPGSTIWSWGRATTASEAKKIALNEATKRGAKDPVIRVWGEESAKSNVTSEVGTKIKVYVDLKLTLEEYTMSEIDTKNNKTAIFSGWTYASLDEINQYGQLYKQVNYWVDMPNSEKKATYLTTTGNYDKYRLNDFGNLNYSPIMKRFVEKIVKNSQYYSKRKINPEYYDGVNLLMDKGVWLYKGIITILNEGWTYDEMRKNALAFYLQPKYSKNHYFIDVNEF